MTERTIRIAILLVLTLLFMSVTWQLGIIRIRDPQRRINPATKLLDAVRNTDSMGEVHAGSGVWGPVDYTFPDIDASVAEVHTSEERRNAIQLVLPLLHASEPYVRWRAIYALGRMGPYPGHQWPTIRKLLKAASNDQDQFVVRESIAILRRIGNDPGVMP